MLDLLGDGNAAALLGLLSGRLLGLAARLGRVCTLGAIEDYLYGDNDMRLRMWGVAIGTAVIGSFALIGAGLLDAPSTIYLGFAFALVLAMVSGILELGLIHGLIAVGIVYSLGQFLESFVLTPKLVGEQIGLHPLAVILALMIFGGLLGFAGVLLALPLAACAVVLGRRLIAKLHDDDANAQSRGD